MAQRPITKFSPLVIMAHISLSLLSEKRSTRIASLLQRENVLSLLLFGNPSPMAIGRLFDFASVKAQ